MKLYVKYFQFVGYDINLNVCKKNSLHRIFNQLIIRYIQRVMFFYT